MTPTELISVMAPSIPTLPPDCAIAVADCVRALVAHTAGKASGNTERSNAKPDAIYAAKGQQYVTRWRTRVERALQSGPLKRDDLRNAVKEDRGKCLPPASFSHLLHALWAKGVIESFEQTNDDGETVSTLWRLCSADEVSNEPEETPKAAKKRAALNTEQAVTDWMWEYLGSFPHYRCDRPEAIAALLAAGAPEQLDSMHRTKAIGNTFGKDKVGFLYIKDRERGHDQNWLMRVVDEDGQPIKRDDSGDIIS